MINNPDELSILKLTVTEDMLMATIRDGRIISITVAWFEGLRNGIHRLIDKDISVRDLNRTDCGTILR